MDTLSGIVAALDGRTKHQLPAMLPTGELAKAMGTAYDWLHGYLKPAERATIVEALVEKAILPIIHEWADPRTRIHKHAWCNWWAVIVGGGGVAALSVLHDVPEAVAWVETLRLALLEWFTYPGGHEEHWFPYVVRDTAPNFEPGGLYGEGFTYLNYGLSRALYFASALADALGDRSLLSQPQLCQVPAAIIQASYAASQGQRVANFNDASSAPPSVELLSGLASLLQSPELQWYLHHSRIDEAEPHAMLWYDPDLPPRAPSVETGWPKAAVFPVFGWVTARTTWGAGATFLALKCGRSVSHGHMDAGGFIYCSRGEALLIDSSLRTNYTDALYGQYDRQTRAHNTVLVDGEGQTGYGKLSQFLTTGWLSYAQSDVTRAYRCMERFVRHVLLIGPEGYLVIADELAASKGPVVFDWLAHFGNMQPPRLEGGTFRYDAERAGVTGVVLAPDTAVFRVETVADNRAEAYLSVRAEVFDANTGYLVLLLPGPPGRSAPSPTVERLPHSGLAVTIPGHAGASYTLLWNPRQANQTWCGQVTTDAVLACLHGRDETLQSVMAARCCRFQVAGRVLLNRDAACTVAARAGGDWAIEEATDL